MRPSLRLTLIAALAAGFALTFSHGAVAQNTDEAHAQCAQGGGQATFSGAGEPNERGVVVPPTVRGFDTIPHAPNNDSGDGSSGGAGGGGGGDEGGVGGAAIARALGGGGRDSVAGSGGGGAEGGLGGTLLGGGAGGCDRLAAPRRLPVTGSGAVSVGIMGASFVAVGGALLLATRYRGRRLGSFLAR
jgi:hypothetical protein